MFKKFLEKIEMLDNVHQWAERDSIIKESVSQHSFKVAAVALFLIQRIEVFNPKADTIKRYSKFKSDVLSYAIMHDFDEAIFGRDVSHIVKYNSYNGKHIREAINEYVEHTLKIEFNGVMPKPSKIVKQFVKLCDWIALLTFIIRNQNMGAKTFENEDIYCREHIIELIQENNEMFMKEFQIESLLKQIINLEEL